ncbi:hypothetical protein TURU_080078 [Turdus rufiventris]|nr:hypothetical protein TURU_080078 [Turdus rufiventris]
MACPQDNCPPGLLHGVREQNGPPVIQEEAVRELLSSSDVHKSMGPDGIHPTVMGELADELAKPLSIIYQQSWLTGEVPDDWKLANVTPIHKSVGRKSLVTYLVDEGKTVDVVYLDFSKALDTVWHSTLLDELAARGLDRSTLWWVKNWLDGRAQRVVVNPAGDQSPVVFVRGSSLDHHDLSNIIEIALTMTSASSFGTCVGILPVPMDLSMSSMFNVLLKIFCYTSGAEEKYKENKGVHEMFSVFFLQITGKHGIRSSWIGIQKRETVKESGKKTRKAT